MRGETNDNKKVHSEMKELKKSLIAEHRERNPGVFVRRELIFWLLAAMVGTRLLYALLSTALFLMHGLDVPAFEYFQMFFMVLVALGFSHIIYSAGVIGAAYLALAGGIFSLFRAFTDGVFFIMTGAGDAILSAIMLIFVATIIIQIVTMAFISVDSKCKLYVQMRAEVSKEMQEWVKANKNN